VLTMEQYWVEGLFVSKQSLKRAKRSGKITQTDIEPYARSYWANTPDEAILLATHDLNGGDWTNGPHVSKTSEEQRMRAMGAPELPGLTTKTKKRKTK
jgi:hypothetical protein